MNEILKKIWKDPVGSNVIAFVITGILGIIFANMLAIYKQTDLLSALQLILSYKLPLWLCLIIVIAVCILFSITIKRRYTRKINYNSEKEKWGIRIQNPEAESIHAREVNAFGSYKDLPEYGKLRLFVVNPGQSKCWLNTQPMCIDASQNKWKTQTYVGTNTDSGKTFYLIAAVDTERPDFWVENFKRAAQATGFYQHLSYPLPAHIIECDKVKIQRA